MSIFSDIFIPFGTILNSFRSKVKGYNYGFSTVQGLTVFNQYGKDIEKMNMILSNPAAMKVFCLQCDLFSMGEVVVKKDDKEIEDDPFLKLIDSPNPFTQTKAQFLWDFMFWNMMGTSYVLVDSELVERKENRMYFLNPAQIEWPQELERRKDKMIFSDQTMKEIDEIEITYRYADGSTYKFPYKKLIVSFDLTNSVGNFFRGPSRIDALYKVITNNEYTLDAENINIRYSGKFLVGSDKQVGTSIRVGMEDEEKDDLRRKIDSSDQAVWPMGSMVKIQRFVSDMANLELKEQYLHQYFVIGSMYGIPRDVLEAYNSSTYENQEKARGGHVSYCLEPKGEQFMDGFENHFGYPEQGKNITISWDHLPFTQVFMKDEIAVKKETVAVFSAMVAAKIPIDQINEYLGTEFEPDETIQGTEGQAQEGGEGQEGATSEPAISEEKRRLRVS